MTNSISLLLDNAQATHQRLFNRPAHMAASAPGRVELLGNHTDYNGGKVLAAAIDRRIVVVGDRSPDGPTRVHSCLLNESIELPANRSHAQRSGTWRDYVAGAVSEARSLVGDVPAFDAVIESSVPSGAGLSSSAALCAALIAFVLELCDHHLSPLDQARLAQRIENLHAGVPCGLLDPYCAMHGRADHVMAIDCARSSHELIPWGDDAPAIVVIDSGRSRSLNTSRYAERGAECERARALIESMLYKPIESLCDVGEAEIAAVSARLPPPLASRTRHVIVEHARVRSAAIAIGGADWSALGAMMRASQESSRLDFENSCVELDLICELARAHPACWGSRLTGAGWAGSTVHLVQRRLATAFLDDVIHQYTARGFAGGRGWICATSDGVKVTTL